MDSENENALIPEEEDVFWPTSSRPNDDDWATVTGEDAETLAQLHAQAQPKEEPSRYMVDRSFEAFL